MYLYIQGKKKTVRIGFSAKLMGFCIQNERKYSQRLRYHSKESFQMQVNFFFFNVEYIFFNFSTTIDIQYYNSFRYTTQWLDINLPSNHPDKSHTHLTLCIVISILLTIFPMLYFTFPWLFCNYRFVLLNPFTFHPSPKSPCHLTTIKMSRFFPYKS